MKPPRQTTILIIEDNAAVRETLVDLITLNGFRALTAADGMAGLAIAQREAPSLIITDISMPVMTGFALLEALHQAEGLRTIPVIVISAKTDRADTRRGMELGAADYITKPFSENEVLRAITIQLEKKALLDELDAFAHTVAHDLKTPLCTLSGRLYLATEGLGKMDEPALRRNLQEASLAAGHLSTIIDELLFLALVRQESIKTKMTALNMGVIVTESLAALASQLTASSAIIHQPGQWPTAHGYAPWLIQVWVNYISNALKYGGPSPQITLGSTVRADGHVIRFWVKDDGPGLDAASQQGMFVPFTRVAKVSATSHGLGLSIVRRIMEKLGGGFGVESQLGAGALFWFELPLAAAVNSTAAAD